MKDSELQALISLLEDEDPGIKTHVEEQLLIMGADVIPRLEKAWETTEDDFLQTRIEDMIHLIQSKAVISNLREWRSAGGGDLLEGWFYVTQYQFPELDITTYRNGINRLVNRIWLELRNGMSVPEKLVVVNRMLFAKENYRPNRKNLNKVQNYFFNGVFETKKGGPISLGLLYMIICHELEISVEGIILPDYFVLTYQDQEQEFFIDVFNKGAFFVRSDLTRFLEELKVEDKSQYYEPSSKVYLILDLIRTLRKCYEKANDEEKVREMDLLLRGIELDQ